MSSPKSLLIETLADSANQVDQTRVRDATLRLEEWRTHSGFFSTLQEIFLDSSIPDEIRFQSIIYVKNNLDRYWRKTAKSAIVDDEKVVIRQGLLQALTLNLPHPWIITNAYTIGRIARHDFPRFWPELVPQLLSTVRNAFAIEESGDEQWRIENALTGLAAVIKELASVKLGMAVSAFHQVTPEIFRFLGQMYQHTAQQWVEQLPNPSPRTKVSAKILGIMRNLLVYGFDKSGDQTDSQTFFDLAVKHFQEFYQAYNNLHGPSQKEVLRHVAKLTKLFSTYASERPFEFLLMHNTPMVVSAFVQICQHEADQFNKPAAETDEERLTVLGKIVIGGISTIRSLLRGLSDPRVLEKERKDRPDQVAVASTTLSAIFNTQNIHELAVLLIKHFLILRRSDLEAWQDDPEEWILEVTGDVVTAESGFRTAGEGLFMELVTEYKDDMTKFIAGCVQSLRHPDMAGPEQVIFRESVYNAVTLNALALYDLIDFDSWLTSVIPAELAYTGPHNNIIRRRMALLVSEWVGTKCAESARPNVYETLLNLLTPLDTRNDTVVRMSAATALRYAVDEWHFKPDDFLPYLEAFLVGTAAEHDKGGIIGLMSFVQHIEARMKLIRVVEVIVERMDRRLIEDHAVRSIHYEFIAVPVGTKPRAEDIQRGCIECSQNLDREQSVEFHSFIVQLIALGTDPSQQEEFVYLFEDALDLWEEAVKNAPTEVKEAEPMTGPEYNFIGLFPRAIACLQFGSENLKKILRIIESYLILDPVGIMQRFADKLFTGFAEIMSELKPEASRTVMSVVEVGIQACPIDLYFRPLVDSGLFFKVVAAVLDDNENMIVTSQYMNILARIALQNPDLLLHVIRTADSSHDVVSQFVERWAGQKFDSIGQAKSRKLNAMGLTALLRTNDPAVLSNLGSIMNVWFNVLSEVKDSEGGDALIYWRDEEEDAFGDEADFGGSYAPSAHDQRKKLLLQHDPVHTTNLMTFMKEHLALVQNKVGGAEMFREVCLRNVDDALVDQMHTMLL